MKYKVLNILAIIFMSMSAIFGAFAPVSAATSYYMLLCGWIVGVCKLLYIYKNSIKNKEFLSGEIFAVIISTILFFMNKEIEAVTYMTIIVVTGELLKYIYGTLNKKKEKILGCLPQKALVYKEGVETEIDAKDLEVGNIVIVNKGEQIPADGVIFRGESLLDGKYLNLEKITEVKKGDVVLGGYLNTQNTIQVEVTKTFEKSFFNRCIVNTINTADETSALEIKFRLYEKILTAVVILGALFTAGIMVFASGVETSTAVTIVVVATASVVMYNASTVTGKSLSSFIYDRLEENIVLKDKSVLDRIIDIEGLILEDDGRIADGDYELVSIVEKENVTKEEILTYAAHLKYFSKSNLSKAVVRAYHQLAKYEGLSEAVAIKFTAVSHVEELPGKGITGKVADKFVCVGNEKLMALLNISDLPQIDEKTMIHVAVNQKYIGSLVLEYIPKAEMEDIHLHWNANGINNYAIDKGNFDELAQELREASSQESTIAYITTRLEGKKEEQVDLVVALDAVERKEFSDTDVLYGFNDLKVISKLKKSIAEKIGNLKMQNILLLVFKTACYGVAAFAGLNILVPTLVDAIITLFYSKINI